MLGVNPLAKLHTNTTTKSPLLSRLSFSLFFCFSSTNFLLKKSSLSVLFFFFSSLREMLDLPAENVYIVHERGDLEFNGHGAVIANYEVFRERPGLIFFQEDKILNLEAFVKSNIFEIKKGMQI